MAENTNISYATMTWSPWIGCSKIASGCLNCYAEADFDIRRGRVKWGPQGTRVKTSDTYWLQPIGWNKHAAAGRCPECKGHGHCGELADDKQAHVACQRCGGSGNIGPYRLRVFPSLCDVFEKWDGPIIDSHGNTLRALTSVPHRYIPEAVPWDRTTSHERRNIELGHYRLATMDNLRYDMFELINKTPNIDWILLTKRPENIRRMWPQANDFSRVAYRNVWLVYSASDQQSLEAGLPHLLECRNLVPVLGVSLEPLIGPIRLDQVEAPVELQRSPIGGLCYNSIQQLDEARFYEPPAVLDWVITGGESGTNARPCDVRWVRSLVNQCLNAGVSVFTKQLGACCIDDDPISRCSWPPLTQFRAFSVESDGRLHDQVVLSDPKGGDPAEWPQDLRVRQFPTPLQSEVNDG